MELLSTLRKIRACEGEPAAQLLLEKLIDERIAADREDREWVLTWSRSQGSLHRERMRETIETGAQMLLGNLGSNDYIVVAVGTEIEIEAEAIALRPYVDARRAADDALGLRG